MMAMTSLVISLLLTLGILALSLLTISKGYGFKHTIDPLEKDDVEAEEVKTRSYQ